MAKSSTLAGDSETRIMASARTSGLTDQPGGLGFSRLRGGTAPSIETLPREGAEIGPFNDNPAESKLMEGMPAHGTSGRNSYSVS